VTDAARTFWLRAQRRAAALEPELSRALLRAFQIIRDAVPQTELARIIDSGHFETLLQAAFADAVLDRAFLPVRDRLRSITADAVRYFARDLPRGGRVDGGIAVSFDVLNPRVIDAIRALDTKVIQTLKDDVRETVRAYVENAVRDGVGPRTVARDLRDVIGLAPNQARAVDNYRTLLETGDSAALRRQLRDKRYDRTTARAFGADGEGLPADTIDAMVAAYRKKMLAFNAETNARTATLDALKAGQRLSWQDAIDAGIVDGARLVKRWIGVKDDRERPEHLAMEGETVPFDQPFSNGEMIPGDSTYNCRCIPAYYQARP